MSIRRSSTHRIQQHATPKESFLASLLDPIDLLAEVIFSVLIVLTFTLWFGVFKLGANPGKVISVESMNEYILAAFGATLAWGMIDGIAYLLLSVLARGERHLLVTEIQAAETDQEAVDVIAGEFDHILEPITGEGQRQALYADMLEHLRDSQPRRVGFQREDLAGALGSVLVAVLAVLPAFVPLVLLRQQPVLAVRLSNIVSFIVLFIAGYQWGRYTGANPWKTGLLLLGAGAIMVAIAISLGG
jgi:VIT1/CCC1 family predicted Fe2+/Mn2+ transporter